MVHLSFVVMAVSCVLFLSPRCNGAVPEPVTCASVIKILNIANTARIHSHDVKYGSGSGQQSVTGVKDMDDNNSHWTIIGLGCARGEAVKCGSVIRLKHLTTHCFLHSHHFNSPLSNNQEVSCFAANNGNGDTGDNWEVQCGDDVWLRNEEVRFKHVDTSTYLALPGQKYGRPIQGQFEVATTAGLGQANKFKSAEGIYVMQGDSN
jgi:dolichyl-phosphate-mannose--protein O-mannosyl transferase